MYTKVALTSALVAFAEARFSQEQIPVSDIASLSNFGQPGEAPTLAGAVPGVLLAAANPCAKLSLADQIVSTLGNDPQVIAAAQKLVAAEQNFNPFAVSVPNICGDASLPATQELRGIIPLVDPAVVGSDVENANSATSLQTPFNANGLSVAQVMTAQGFSNFTVNGAAAGGANGNNGNNNGGNNNNNNNGNNGNGNNNNGGNKGNNNNNGGNKGNNGNGNNNNGNNNNNNGNNNNNNNGGNKGNNGNNGGGAAATTTVFNCGGSRTTAAPAATTTAASGNNGNGNNNNNGNGNGNNNNNGNGNGNANNGGNAGGNGAAAGAGAVSDAVTGTFAGFQASSLGLDFGTCTPTVKFEESLNGRKAGEFTFQAQDPVVNKGQQEALNPNIIFNRICDQLGNVCNAADDAIAACKSAQADLGSGPKDATTADAWNTALGFDGADINPDNAPKAGLVGHT